MENLTAIMQECDGLINAGQFKQCEDILVRSLNQDSSLRLHLSLAKLRYIYLAKTKLAEKDLKRLLHQYPNEQEINLCLIDLYYLIYRDEEAIALCTEFKKNYNLPKDHWIQYINILVRNHQ